ncbi:MAG: RES family NAD+ phosphorylase [Planctomycetes bacterium]|nr:RES family NAD+ phosphorylase [Planctomycetota bacterium]
MAGKEAEPGVRELFDAIAACEQRAIPFQGTVMRSVGIRHANAKGIFSGDGAAVRGGRWNPRGIKAVYASQSVITAVREAYQELLRFGFSASAVRPRAFCGAEVSLQSVLDLTDKNICRAIGFTVAELVDEDWLAIQQESDESWTQAIGRGAYEAGFEGLLAPSARDRPGGINLVVFPKNLRPGSRIDIIGKDDLPPHPAGRR